MNTKKLTALAMLSAIAFIMSALIRVPVVLFLRYDPKDIIITIAGFVYGPMAAFLVTLVVAFVQMFTISQTGPWGFLMNVIASASFCCTAAYIYKIKPNTKGVIIGLAAAFFVSTAIMMLWNYTIVPMYMPGVTREAVAPLLLTAFLPFNLISNGLNAAFTVLLFKHVKKILQTANLLPPLIERDEYARINIGLILAAVFVALSCIMWVLSLRGVL